MEKIKARKCQDCESILTKKEKDNSKDSIFSYCKKCLAELEEIEAEQSKDWDYFYGF